MGQKEDLFCLFLGQPGCHEGCIHLHGHRWTTAPDKLIYTGRGNNPCWGHTNISMSTLPQSGGRDPLLMSIDWGPAIESVDIWHEFMGVEWKDRGGRRWDALWCACMCLWLQWSCDLLRLQTHHSLKQGCSRRTTRFNRCAMHLEAPPCSYPVVCSWCELLLFGWAWSSCSIIFFPFAYNQTSRFPLGFF